MQQRIRYINEKGKEILLVDLVNCLPSEVAQVARIVPNHVTARPRASVLLLVNFTGASFDDEAIRVLKESAVFDKPYIRKSAWIGSVRQEIHNDIRNFSRRDLPIFATIQQAISWLVKD